MSVWTCGEKKPHQINERPTIFLLSICPRFFYQRPPLSSGAKWVGQQFYEYLSSVRTRAFFPQQDSLLFPKCPLRWKTNGASIEAR